MNGEGNRTRNKVDELIPIAERIAEILKRRKETIAVSESSAGGLISAALLAIPGASEYFLGGAVTYTRKAIQQMLAPPQSSSPLRGLTPETALYLAHAARERLASTWAVSEIGAAGPTGSRYGDTAGTTCIAICGPRENARKIQTGSGNRADNMQAFAKAALDLLLENLAAN